MKIVKEVIGGKRSVSVCKRCEVECGVVDGGDSEVMTLHVCAQRL